jgi:hypothetical protein
MKTYTSLDGIQIKVGEDAKENDNLTFSSYPSEWWLHVDGGPGSHVIICSAILAIHHGKSTSEKTIRVNLVRVDQVIKDERIKNHGQVYLDGSVMQMTIFKNKEKDRLERLLKTRRND